MGGHLCSRQSSENQPIRHAAKPNHRLAFGKINRLRHSLSHGGCVAPAVVRVHELDRYTARWQGAGAAPARPSIISRDQLACGRCPRAFSSEEQDSGVERPLATFAEVSRAVSCDGVTSAQVVPELVVLSTCSPPSLVSITAQPVCSLAKET